MHSAEGDPGVVSLQHDTRTSGVQPEPEAVAAGFGGTSLRGRHASATIFRLRMAALSRACHSR